MFIGEYLLGEKVWVCATTHKFTTGQELASTVTGYYLKVGDAFGSAVALTFNIFNAETGIYYAEIDTTGFAKGTYVVVVEANVDTVIANQMQYFSVRGGVGIYGESIYTV